MKIAYVPESFPVQTETFVVNEIAAMIDGGHQIGIVPRLWSNIIKSSESLDKVLSYSELIKKRNSKIPLAVLYSAIKYSGIGPARLRPKILYSRFNAIISVIDTVMRLRSFRPDVIITHFGYDNAVASAIYASVYSIKNILYFHGSDVHTVPHRNIKWFAELSTVVTNSEYMQAQLLKLGVKDVKVSPPGIKTERFSHGYEFAKHENPLILSIARLGHNKDHSFMISVFIELKKRVPKAELWIVGDGPDRKRLTDLVAASGACDVKFLGALSHDEIPLLISKAWIFSLFSVQEALGMVFLEAQAGGLPCVSNAVGGIPEVIGHGKSGFLISERDETGVIAAANYMMLLLTDADLRDKFSAAAFLNAETFSSEHHISFMCSLVSK